ncbi:MAG TPA: DUF3089 domain-containing protein [Gaiellaceae bacterium]|nr:DUF3089 domain-containing protein [Gaiellaceae bacterium]
MRSLLLFTVLLALVLAGCGGAKRKPPAVSSTPRDEWGTVWLCRPGLADDPCTSDLTTTVVAHSGAQRVERTRIARTPAVDCFYVYPTISGQRTINANLTTDFREREIAIAQASRFSQFCHVYAPVYRQITLYALEHPARITLADARRAYDSVLSAFRDYLAHYNHGRGIVFIGHSQGAEILIRLLAHEVDGRALRHRLVSALLLGGNLTAPRGKSVGGDFAHIPTCRSSRQTGCVVAYSSFSTKPPANSQFGRTTSDSGVRLLAPRNPSPTLGIVCVNPAAPAGGPAVLDPYIPALVLAFLPAARTLTVQTPWVAFPHAYTARCESSGNATWLQVTHAGGGADRRPSLTRLRDAALGLHVLDVTIALGNLVRLVGDEAAAYASAH